MVNFEQYPHYLYQRTDTGAHRTDTGSWVQGQGEWTLAGRCRNESNGKGSSITTADGRTLIFSAVIQMPKATPRIDEGTEIAVTSAPLTDSELAAFEENSQQWKTSGKLLERAQVAKFDSGRLHCRAWI